MIAQSPVNTPVAPIHRPARFWAERLAGILFSLFLTWMILEMLLRVLFFYLPPRLQLVLERVHITPFSEQWLMPDPIWHSDIDYLTIARPVTNFEQYGSADVHFNVTTETLWGSRVAFRTRQELVDRHVDAVAVGDSFTFCFTEEKDCWVTLLGQQTNRNIINLGIVSTGSVSHQRVLQDFGMPLKPPLVIWQWWGNDSNEDYGLASLRGETTIQSTNPPPAAPVPTWWDQNSAVYVLLKLFLGSDKDFDASLQFLDREHASNGDVKLAFGRPYLWDAFDMSEPTNQYGWERSRTAFYNSNEMVKRYGGMLLFVLIPTKEQVYREIAEPLIGEEKMALLDQNYQMMLDLCQEQQMTCLDLLPVLQAHAQQGEQLYHTNDIHLNARGNLVLADALSLWLDAHPEIFAS